MKKFKNWTIQEKLIAWLESKGFIKTTTRTGKYVAMFKENGTSDGMTYLIGKAGAFRWSAKGTVKDSVSVKPAEAFTWWCDAQEDKK